MEKIEKDEVVYIDPATFFNKQWVIQAKLEIQKLFGSRSQINVTEIKKIASEQPNQLKMLLQAKSLMKSYKFVSYITKDGELYRAYFDRFFEICDSQLRMNEKFKAAINDIESKGEEFRNNVNKFIASNFNCCEDEDEEHKGEDGECLTHKFYFEQHYLSNFEQISLSLSHQLNLLGEFLEKTKHEVPDPMNHLLSELSTYMRNISDGHQTLVNKYFFIINQAVEANQSLALKLKGKDQYFRDIMSVGQKLEDENSRLQSQVQNQLQVIEQLSEKRQQEETKEQVYSIQMSGIQESTGDEMKLPVVNENHQECFEIEDRLESKTIDLEKQVKDLMNKLKDYEEVNKRQSEEFQNLKNEAKINERQIEDLTIQNRHLKDAQAINQSQQNGNGLRQQSQVSSLWPYHMMLSKNVSNSSNNSQSPQAPFQRLVTNSNIQKNFENQKTLFVKGITGQQTFNSKLSITGKQNQLKELEKMFVLKDDDFYEDDNESYSLSSKESPHPSPEVPIPDKNKNETLVIQVQDVEEDTIEIDADSFHTIAQNEISQQLKIQQSELYLCENQDGSLPAIFDCITFDSNFSQEVQNNLMVCFVKNRYLYIMKAQKNEVLEREILFKLDFEEKVITIMQQWSNQSIGLFEYLDAIEKKKKVLILRISDGIIEEEKSEEPTRYQLKNSLSLLTKEIYQKTKKTKMDNLQETYQLSVRPSKVLIISTLEVRGNYPWNDRFDGQHLMHGRLRTAKKREDMGVIDYIKSIFKEPPSPPLIDERYYVLTQKGKLHVYEFWNSSQSKILQNDFQDYHVCILPPKKHLKKFPGTIGVIIQLKHKIKGKLVFAADTQEQAKLWHNSFVQASTIIK